MRRWDDSTRPGPQESLIYVGPAAGSSGSLYNSLTWNILIMDRAVAAPPQFHENMRMVISMKNQVFTTFETIPDDVASLMERAWEVRAKNFPGNMELVFPGKTRSLSLTGRECSLNCAHCGGHYLKGMKTPEQALSDPRREEITSYLISGGYTHEGKVPLAEHWEELHLLKKRGRLNFHTGLLSREEAEALAPLADAVSFDFVGDDELIKKVYGDRFKVKDFLKSYGYLLDALGPEMVVPHMIIGLDEGKIDKEMNGVKLLRDAGLHRLVLLILNPTRGTRFARCTPPEPAAVAALLARIRLVLPTTPITLGCMRPGGSYRERVDILALGSGINKIVTPTPTLERFALDLGLHVTWGRECCVL